MYLSNRGASSAVSCSLELLTPQRLLACSGAMLICYAAFLATWAWAGSGFTMVSVGRPGLDFSIFWTASHLMMHNPPAQIYDHIAFANSAISLFGGFADGYGLPWLYPPASVLWVAPLAWLPYALSYLLFMAVGIALYVAASARLAGLDGSLGGRRAAALVIAASPCVFVTAIVGQNSLFTAALAAFALYSLADRPVRAAILIGLLAALKPQLAIVFPVVLIAVGAWRVLAVAAASALVVSLAGVLIGGTASLHGFLANANVLRTALLEHGQHFWLSSPTPFAAFRLAGMPVEAAYAAHAAVAVVAIWAAWHVWRSTRDWRLRSAIVLIATLLASPYAWHYELVWLGIALACLSAHALDGGWLRGEQAILACGWILPVYEHFNRVMVCPQIGPLVLLAMVLLVLRRARPARGFRS